MSLLTSLQKIPMKHLNCCQLNPKRQLKLILLKNLRV